MRVNIQELSQHGQDESYIQNSGRKQDAIDVNPLVVKKVSLDLEYSSVDGMCSCVCISDCSCDSTW